MAGGDDLSSSWAPGRTEGVELTLFSRTDLTGVPVLLSSSSIVPCLQVRIICQSMSYNGIIVTWPERD